MPAWGGLLPALRSGAVPWAEAHPAETAAGRDFWKYMEVGSPEQFMKRAGPTTSASVEAGAFNEPMFVSTIPPAFISWHSTGRCTLGVHNPAGHLHLAVACSSGSSKKPCSWRR